MTYYECIVLLREITNSQINEELLNKLNNSKIVFYTDVKYRYAINVINAIKVRETRAFEQIIAIIINKNMSFDEFSLELLKLKKELDYTEKIANNKLIHQECQADIIKVFENIFTSYSKFVEELLLNYYSSDFVDEYYSILNRKR